MLARDVVVNLDDVYWIGGSPAAGKSTTALRLAAAHGLRVYATDDVMTEHAARLSDREAPQLTAFARMSPDERWVERSPSAMLDTFPWFRGEGFRLVVDDLRALSVDGPVIAEGFRLLPALVAPLLRRRSRAVWLLPTVDFARRVLERRSGGPDDVPGRTSDPERARRNLLERDAMFTQRLTDDVRRLGLSSVRVDPASGEEATATVVAELLGLSRGGDGTASRPDRPG